MPSLLSSLACSRWIWARFTRQAAISARATISRWWKSHRRLLCVHHILLWTVAYNLSCPSP